MLTLFSRSESTAQLPLACDSTPSPIIRSPAAINQSTFNLRQCGRYSLSTVGTKVAGVGCSHFHKSTGSLAYSFHFISLKYYKPYENMEK